MSKHTPGPWIIWADCNGRLQVGVSTNYSVAEMWQTFFEGQEANARLIAAAPDLLDRATALLNALDRDLPHSMKHHASGERFNLRAAIAKATEGQ